MDRLDLGRIPPESIAKVRKIIADSRVAVSKDHIRTRATIKSSSLDKILLYLEFLNKVERVRTTSGDFWIWRNGNGD